MAPFYNQKAKDRKGKPAPPRLIMLRIDNFLRADYFPRDKSFSIKSGPLSEENF